MDYLVLSSNIESHENHDILFPIRTRFGFGRYSILMRFSSFSHGFVRNVSYRGSCLSTLAQWSPHDWTIYGVPLIPSLSSRPLRSWSTKLGLCWFLMTVLEFATEWTARIVLQRVLRRTNLCFFSSSFIWNDFQVESPDLTMNNLWCWQNWIHHWRCGLVNSLNDMTPTAAKRLDLLTVLGFFYGNSLRLCTSCKLQSDIKAHTWMLTIAMKFLGQSGPLIFCYSPFMLSSCMFLLELHWYSTYIRILTDDLELISSTSLHLTHLTFCRALGTSHGSRHSPPGLLAPELNSRLCVKNTFLDGGKMDENGGWRGTKTMDRDTGLEVFYCDSE